MKCPLCAGRVVYEGIFHLECATIGCSNRGKSEPSKPDEPAKPGTYAWALWASDHGYFVEKKTPGYDVWNLVDPKNLPAVGVFRLGRTSDPAGSKGWAQEHATMGFRPFRLDMTGTIHTDPFLASAPQADWQLDLN